MCNCSPGEVFDVCTVVGAQGAVKIGAMICADREFPEAAGQLMLTGAELIMVPNSCTWDEIRTAGLKTRAFENLVGIAMVNYPEPVNNGNSQAFTCAAWRDGKSIDTLIAKAGEREEILLATFDMDEIREFRSAESWRMDYRRARAAKFTRYGKSFFASVTGLMSVISFLFFRDKQSWIDWIRAPDLDWF